MRKAKSIVSLLLAAVLTINTVPVSASAAGVKSAQNQPKTVAVPQTVMVQADIPAEAAVDDSEEMFRLYAEQAFAEAAGQEMIMPYGTTAGDYLEKDTTPKLVYEALKPLIKQVADGEAASTVFTLQNNDGPCANMVWTKDDFGGQELYKELPDGQRQIRQEVIDTIFSGNDAKWVKKLDLDAIFWALMADCPKDLYWYDKTKGMSGGPTQYVISSNCESIYVTSLKFTFTPAVEYAVGNLSEYKQDSDYQVNTEKTGAAQSAITNAKAIVEEVAKETLSDQEILKKYKDKIKELSEYNFEAAENIDTVAYGNPWQLIWVFDKDSDTKVVCEGYSKAFQFLCDLSTSWDNGNTIFDDENFQCYSVTGKMGTLGDHMWNVVELDGIKYMVDVTNTESYPTNDRDFLFLEYVYADDEIGSKHTFDFSKINRPDLGRVTYEYFEYEKDLHCDGYLRLGPAPLEVDTTNPVSIPASTVGTAITEVDISGKISGGKKPYSYAITEPANSWLKISTDGKITGTPTAVAEASTITVTITDADNKTTTMTISVGAVTSAKQDLRWFGAPQTTATYGDANIRRNHAKNFTTDGAQTITYSSSDDKVATVEASSGEVTIIGVGETTITATVASTENYDGETIDYTLKVNPADYTYTFPTTLGVRKGSAASTIGHGQKKTVNGVNDEQISGTLYWYKDADCTIAVTDGDLATVGTVPLYGKFVPDGANKNYVTTEKKSASPTSVQVMDVSFSVSGEEATDSTTVMKNNNTTYGNQWQTILKFYTGLKASYNGDDDTDYNHFDFLIGTERKSRSEIGDTYPDAGTYPYDVVYNGTIKGETFTDVIVCSGSVTVAPKTLTGEDLQFEGAHEKTFDGTTKSSMTVSVKPSSLVKAKDSVTIQTDAYYDNMNAGSGKTITVYVSYPVTGNYALTAGNTFTVNNGKITPKVVTVTLGGDPSGVTYKEGGPTLTATYTDVHGQTKSDVTLTKTSYTSDGPQWPNAGTYSLSAVIEDQNYQADLSDQMGYLINKATLQAVMNTIKDIRYNDSAMKTVTARDLGIEAAGKFQIAEGDDSNSILEIVTGETGSFTYRLKDSLTEQNGKDKLTATIKVNFIPDNTNYATINDILVTIRLTEKEAINDITLTMADSVYGTATADPQASTGATGGSWSYVYTGNYTDGYETPYASTSVKPSLPGHYTVTATYESETHKGSKSTTFTIAPKQLTYTGLTVEDKTYNGTKTAKVTGTLAYAGFVETDGNNVGAPAAIDGAVFTYADEKVGNGKTVSVSGYTPGSLTGEDAWKYLAPESLELKGNILAPTAPVVTGTENEDPNKKVTNSTIEENFASYNEQVQELYADAAALKSAMKVAAQKANADLGANLQFYHLRIQKETNDGLTDVNEPTDVLLPYPENTGKEGYDFVVVQMQEDGTMETIQPTKGEYGLSLTLSYGGPVSIAWCRSAAPVQPDAPNNNGGSSNGGSNNGGSATNNGTTAGGNSNSSSNSNGSATLIEVSKVNTATEKTSVPTSDNAGSAMLTASAEAVLALAALGVTWFFRKRRAW